MMRLDKLLSNMGYGSRREIKSLVKSGHVEIDGKTIEDPSSKVDTDESKVFVRGEHVEYRKYTYIMLNKPAGIVSSTDSRDTNVIDILDGKLKNISLFPAGRLDKDTEGFVLLTNDGKMAHNILSPKKHVEKEYYVELDGELSENGRISIENGITLEDGSQCLDCRIEMISNEMKLCKLKIFIREGKYHQIKRMFEMTGRKVTYLKRLSIGDIRLDSNLEKGEYRELSSDELDKLPVSED
nr:pseudouridine synthase [Dethiosulfatibacter aminovorans]